MARLGRPHAAPKSKQVRVSLDMADVLNRIADRDDRPIREVLDDLALALARKELARSQRRRAAN